MFSTKKWKFTILGLMAVLAVGFSIPQAFAHVTNNTQHVLQHIYNFVDGIEAKTNNLPSDPASNTVVNTRATQASVNALQQTADDIDSKAGDIQNLLTGGSAGMKGLTVDTTAIGDDGDVSLIEVLPFSQDKIYVGHIVVHWNVPINTIYLGCAVGDGPELKAIADHSIPNGFGPSVDFWCNSLTVVITHRSSEPVPVWANIVYQEIPSETASQ
jgi:hypothetical protein